MRNAHWLAALAAVLVVGAVSPAAHAVQVTYSTSGTFGSSGTALLSQGGAQIRFNPIATAVDANPLTSALFGSFTTLAAPAGPGLTLVDTFTLTITQSGPAPGGALVFTSSVGGRIFLNNSEAFVQFDEPLVQAITSGGATTSYRIAAGGAAGLFGGPGQEATINGEIGVTGTDAGPDPSPAADGGPDTGILSAPEPGTLAMACVALPLIGLGYVRNRRRDA
jgi:hypothetical protein